MSHGSGDSGPSLVDLLTLGAFNLVCVVAGLGLGLWADSSTELTPVLTLVGLAVGVGVGVFGTWVRIRPLLDDGAAGDRGRDQR